MCSGSSAPASPIITTVHDDAPVGFACQSFAALSLDPPLVLFCPTKVSRSWQAIEASGQFCVNVLHEKQKDVSARFGSKEPDKFAGIDWSPSKLGSPIIEGTLAHIDCTVHSVHDGGDHFVVFGAVQSLSEVPHRASRGRCCSTAATTPASSRTRPPRRSGVTTWRRSSPPPPTTPGCRYSGAFALKDGDRHHQPERELRGGHHERLPGKAVGFQTAGHVDAQRHRGDAHHDHLRHDSDEAEDRGGD